MRIVFALSLVAALAGAGVVRAEESDPAEPTAADRQAVADCIAKAGEEGIQIILGNGRDGQGQRAQQGGQPTYHRMTPCLSGRGVPYPNQAGRCNGFMRSFSAKPAGLYTP